MDLSVTDGSYRAAGSGVAWAAMSISAGAELQLGTEPDLFLDGRCCCDQTAAHYLVHAGLITGATQGVIGRRVAAVLTPAGHDALGAYALAA